MLLICKSKVRNNQSTENLAERDAVAMHERSLLEFRKENFLFH